MKKYIFSLFVRFFIAITGFAGFLVSALQYGPEGRGIIAYGMGLVSIFALVFSFNLGRAFLFEVSQYSSNNTSLNHSKLEECLSLNLILIVLANIFIVFFIFLFIPKNIIPASHLLLFTIMTPYYLWNVNGTVFYAVMNLTYKQELIILLTRIILLVFLAYQILMPSKIEAYIFYYASILAFGTIFEMLFLANPIKKLFKYIRPQLLIKHAKNSFLYHIDYLAFHLYPLILIFISGFSLNLKEIGRLNFGIQLVNFIFLFSFVASIRVKSFVALNGSLFYYKTIFKIFLTTLILSVISIVFIFYVLNSDLYSKYFNSFEDMRELFLIFSLAIPGYMVYQFFYPLTIENNKIKLSAMLNAINFFFFLIVAIYAVPSWNTLSVPFVYSGFFSVAMLIQLYLNKRFFIQ